VPPNWDRYRRPRRRTGIDIDAGAAELGSISTPVPPNWDRYRRRCCRSGIDIDAGAVDLGSISESAFPCR